MEAVGRRLALERGLHEGALDHCGFFLGRACLEWETGAAGAGAQAFERAWRVCDAKAVAARGRVAARLDGGDYAGAYAVWREGSAAGGADSLALAAFEPAVFAGLSLTDFPSQGPAAYRLAPGPWDPQGVFWLSLAPGAGFLRIGEGRLALQHLVLGSGLTALLGWRLASGFRGADHPARMAAFLDAGILALLWKRYYLGGMREAGRLARVKKRRQGAARVRALWSGENPFRPSDRPGGRDG